MIIRSDYIRYGDLQESLLEGMHKGQDEFPETVVDAYDLLQRIINDIYQSQSNNQAKQKCFLFCRNKQSTNLSFTQKGKTSELVPGRDGKVHKEIECHNCHQIGHYANQCPHKKKITLAQFTLAQNKLELIDRNWVLLDTCSTVSVFCNSKLVNDIREVCPGSSLTGITNGGLQTYKYTANFNLLPLRVHFNTHSIANILSLSDIANLPNTKITMDSSKEKVMLLHHNGRIIKFEECVDGHYYWDSKETSSLKSKDSITAYLSD